MVSCRLYPGKEVISCLGNYSLSTEMVSFQTSDTLIPIVMSANHTPSGEIFGHLPRFPQSEIFYPSPIMQLSTLKHIKSNWNLQVTGFIWWGRDDQMLFFNATNIDSTHINQVSLKVLINTSILFTILFPFRLFVVLLLVLSHSLLVSHGQTSEHAILRLQIKQQYYCNFILIILSQLFEKIIFSTG
jgi:hypothetical protein